MNSLSALSKSLTERRNLSDDEVEIAAAALASADINDDEKETFLVALNEKGESPSEIAAFARAFRKRAVNPGLERWSGDAVDIVGTGGDHAGGFNVSSLVVLTLAASGVPVIKHGNRAVTSVCGSADLFEAIGVPLNAPPEVQAKSMEQLNLAFLFAPNYHPAFKYVAPVRKKLGSQGRRTVFNLLGPLINPGLPSYALLGVYAPKWVDRFAEVYDLLGLKAGLVVHGVIAAGKGIDELTTCTPNLVHGFGRLRDIDDLWNAVDYGFPATPFGELVGGDVQHNLRIVEAVISGKAPPGLVNTIVFNAATAMWISEKVPSIVEGVGIAKESLLGGGVRAKLKAIREFYQK